MVYKVKRYSVLDQREYGFTSRQIYKALHPETSSKVNRGILDSIATSHKLKKWKKDMLHRTPGQNSVDIPLDIASAAVTHPSTLALHTVNGIGQGVLMLTNPLLAAEYMGATSAVGPAQLLTPGTLILDKKIKKRIGPEKIDKLVENIERVRGSKVASKMKNIMEGVIKGLPGYVAG